MNDIKILAEKILGWKASNDKDGNEVFVRPKEEHMIIWARDFDPRNDDNDCMALWDKFSEKHYTSLICNTGIWNAQILDDFGHLIDETSRTDRREAMLECMLKAVKESA